MRVQSLSAGCLPVTMVVMLGTGMVVAYIWAQARNDVPSLLPFISSTGGNPPQSGVFAIFLFFSATTAILTIVIRHVTLHQEACGLGLKHSRRLNHLGLFLGLLLVTGIFLVAAYPVMAGKILETNQTQTQEDTNQWVRTVLMPHSLGAFLCFGVGIAYTACQSFLSLFIRPACGLSHWRVEHVRLFAARIVACFIAVVALVLHIMENEEENLWKDTPRSRTSALCEWILVLMLMLQFLSLYPEMKPIVLQLSIHAPPCGRIPSP